MEKIGMWIFIGVIVFCNAMAILIVEFMTLYNKEQELKNKNDAH